MKRNVSKLAALLCLIVAVSLFAVCGGQSAEAEAEAPAIGHEYASESDPLGAFLERVKQQLLQSADVTGFTWEREETSYTGEASYDVITGQDMLAGNVVLYRNGPDGEKMAFMFGGSWAVESERLVSVYCQVLDQDLTDVTDRLTEAVYSDQAAEGLAAVFAGCMAAEEVCPNVRSTDTATLNTMYSYSLQLLGEKLQKQGDVLYFLDGDAAVVWGLCPDEDTPYGLIPETLGGCSVRRVCLSILGDSAPYIESCIAVPGTAETVDFVRPISTIYIFPENVKTLICSAVSTIQYETPTIMSCGRDTQVIMRNARENYADSSDAPEIYAYFGTPLAGYAEDMGWDVVYLDPFDGSWEETERMISERLDRYEAEDPEAYSDLLEGITRDELLQLAKENWEDMMEDAGDLGEDERAAYSQIKAGDYSLLESGEAWQSSSSQEQSADAPAAVSTQPPAEASEQAPVETSSEPVETAVPEEFSVVASGACGDADSSLTWSLSDSGVLTISGSGRMKDYSHPQYAPQSSFDEWQVWDSAPWLYYDICTGADGLPLCRIQQVRFGEGVTYIGEYAFTYSHIPSAALPEGLTEIGAGAFGSSDLASVTLPSTLTTVGGGAFTGCMITSLTIPEGVTAVCGNAFGNSGCSATTGAQNMIVSRQITDVTILSASCVIEDTGKEHNAEDYAGWDNIYTIGDPAYTIIHGYPGSTAEAFARKWGYTFQSLDDVSEQAAAGKKLLAVETYGENGTFSGETRYEYNDDGLPVRSYVRSANDTSWKAECIYTYDEAGRLLNKCWSSDYGAYRTDVFVRSYNDDGTLASSSYTGIQDMWNTDEYFYDESGLAVREKHTIYVGDVPASGYYSFENSVDEQGNLTAIRHDEDSPEPRDAVFVYGPDGRMLQGYDEYWLTPITYTYVDDPCFCVRDETGSVGDGYGGMESYTQRVAYILDSAGKEVESFILGTAGEMELTYDENGYLSSAKRYFDGWQLGETRFIYGDPADAPAIAVDAPAEAAAVAVDAPTEDNAAQVQAESGVLTITGDQVNIRSGPGTEYESLGQADQGTRLPYTGKSGNWYRVEYNGMEAYVIEDYIMTDGGYYVQMASGTLSVNGDDVNIRSGPGIGYEAIGQVSRGDTLTFTGKSDNWYEVEYKGGTGYIIEDYVVENSAEPAAVSTQDTGAMDESVLAATLEGDWSGFIGALAERYGVVSTSDISMSGEGTMWITVWRGSDITGLLSATVLDLDLDGQQELFTVRMDYFSGDWYGEGNYEDHTHLYLTVYEPGSGTPAAERVFFPIADIVGDNLGAMSQFAVFTYDYAGVRYICLDNYATMNETQTIVNFFSYDGSQLVFEGAGDYEEYGEGSVYVYRADTEPAAFQDFTLHSYTDDTAWQKVMDSHDQEQWRIVGTEAEKDYFRAYADILAEHGLLADHDERIWINQTDDDRFAYCPLTAPEVYTAAEGELRPLAQAGRVYEYDSEGKMLVVLHRTDCEGTLDSYR